MRNGDDDLAAMDDLTYTYYDSKNQLKRIVDGVPAGNYPDDIDSQPDEVNYEYDANGSVVKDRSEAINTITWTNAGKVESILWSYHIPPSKSLEFAYDGLGNRVKKDLVLGDDHDATWYVKDASGNILAVYQKAGEDVLKLKERPIYGSSRLGVLTSDVGGPAGSNLHHITGDRQYELTDHLGNVLATISDKRIIEQNPTKYKAEIKSVGDYYPFGMLMPGRKNDPGIYRFGFNGQEKDDEITGMTGSHLSFKYRIEDTRICRFFSVDPLVGSFPWNSPYAFAENRSIDGRELEAGEWSSSIINNTEVFNVKIKVYNHSQIIDNTKAQAYLASVEPKIENVFKKQYDIKYDLNIEFSLMEKTAPEGSGFGEGYNEFALILKDLFVEEGQKYKQGTTLMGVNTQSNLITYGITVNRELSSEELSIRTISHELAHTAGVQHPWETDIEDIKQIDYPTRDIRDKIKINLMNTADNPKTSLQIYNKGIDFTKGQIERIKEVVHEQEKN